jgi:hypothetical protein
LNRFLVVAREAGRPRSGKASVRKKPRAVAARGRILGETHTLVAWRPASGTEEWPQEERLLHGTTFDWGAAARCVSGYRLPWAGGMQLGRAGQSNNSTGEAGGLGGACHGTDDGRRAPAIVGSRIALAGALAQRGRGGSERDV